MSGNLKTRILLNFKKFLQIFVPLLAVYYLSLVLSNFVWEIFWTLHHGKYLTDFLFWKLHSGFVTFFACLTALSITLKFEKWKKLFGWKIWAIPSLVTVVFAFTQWKLDPALNNSTGPFFVSWQWTGIITWISLFILQLILYQKKGVDNVASFTLSYYGVLLASSLYEAPWLVSLGNWKPLTLAGSYMTYRLYATIIFVAILAYLRWKPNKLTLLSLLPLAINYFAFLTLPYWSVRLTVFPLFLTIPLGFAKK